MSETNATSKKEKGFTPILPYDITVGEDFNMYQSFAYRRDISLFDNNEQMLERGNVIHCYRCNVQEARPIGGDPVSKEETDPE